MYSFFLPVSSKFVGVADIVGLYTVLWLRLPILLLGLQLSMLTIYVWKVHVPHIRSVCSKWYQKYTVISFIVVKIFCVQKTHEIIFTNVIIQRNFFEWTFTTSRWTRIILRETFFTKIYHIDETSELRFIVVT